MKISQVLTETRDLLSDESRWAQGMAAQDESGFGVSVADKNACRWCLAGGIMKVLSDNDLTGEVWDYHYSSARKALAQTIGYAGNASIALWNDEDERKHSEVISALNATISVVALKEKRGEMP